MFVTSMLMNIDTVEIALNIIESDYINEQKKCLN